MPTTLVCKVMGVVFILVAIWGFIDGERVLMFHVNTMHNIVHLASGILALVCGFLGERESRGFSMIFGSMYALAALLGFMEVAAVVDLLHLNAADNWLHLGLGLLFLLVGLGVLSPRRSAPTPSVRTG